MKLITTTLFFLLLSVCDAQTETSTAKISNDPIKALIDYAKDRKAFKEKIKIDVTNLTVSEILILLAEQHELNVSVDFLSEEPVTTTLYDVTVLDVYMFLVDKYKLQVTASREILVFTKEEEKMVIQEVIKEKPLDITYNSQNKFISLKVKNDSLFKVIMRLSELTGENIVLRPKVKNKVISSYVLNRPIGDVIELLAAGNGLISVEDLNGVFYLDEGSLDNSVSVKPKLNATNKEYSNFEVLGEDFISINDQGYLKITVKDMPLKQIIESAAIKSNVNYFIYDQLPAETRTLKVSAITFDDLLKHLFSGKTNSYSIEDDVFLIGNDVSSGIRKTKLIKMQNRTIENVLPSLPLVFTQKLEIKEFIELNALIATGNNEIISELVAYLQQIDEVVPLVDIQVIIVQYQNGYNFRTGLQIGKDDQPRANRGIIYPNVDGTLNRDGINKLIDAFNGFGLFNIGKVTENFYLNLELLETNSIIKIHSTPRIAALSGHPANLSIGNTDYYFEQSNTLITRNVTADVLQTGTWKATDANLSVNILPYVSTDENITLKITVEQDSFTGRVAENAPPGKITQNFDSLIRVRNNEMILLGGLDEINSENNGSGTPFLSRIPGISWLFSNRSKSKTKSKLHIFIKPTIIY